MGERSRERRSRRAWLTTRVLPYLALLAERVRKMRPRAAYRLGVNLGHVLRWLGVTRKTVRRNLTLACGSLPPRGALREFEKRYYRHLGLMTVEFLRQPTWTPADIPAFGPGVDRIREVYGEGRGTIFVAGHAGLWEMAGHVAGMAGCELLSVAKLSGHEGLDAWVSSIRESGGGQEIRNVIGSMWSMKKALDRGKGVGINVDQEARKGRVFAPFFGIRASTSNTPALLHLKTGAPVVVATVHRTGPLRYALEVYDVIRHQPSGDRAADVLAITTRINACMEAMIRRHPEQWLWSHRRWRRRPDDETTPFARLPGAEVLRLE